MVVVIIILVNHQGFSFVIIFGIGSYHCGWKWFLIGSHHYDWKLVLIGSHARSQGGSTGSIEPPSARSNPPQPGPEVLFLNLHACH